MAYKTFTNGSPLPASDLMTYLMNQSVMVFADATARSAALTAPTEGMITYLEDTGLVYVYNGSSWVDINDNSGAIPKSTVTTAGDLIVADGNASVTRLGIGTNGQVLSSNGTTATWISPASGGMTLLSTTSLSGSSSVTINGISQDYKNLFVWGTGIKSTNIGDDLKFRPNSTDTYVHGFKYGATYSSASAIIIDTIGSANPTNFYAFIPDYTTANFHNFNLNANGNGDNDFWFLGLGTYSSAAITSLNLTSTANFTAGSVRIYGGN